MLVKVRAEDIIRPSTMTGDDLPLLELLPPGPSVHARLGNNSNDLGCAVNC